MIKYLIFDLDGTLINQYEANGKAYAVALDKVGAVFDEDVYKDAYGLRFDEFMQKIAPKVDKSLHQQIKDDKAEAYKQHFHLIQPNHGLIELIKSSHGQFKTALVTTARRQNVDNILDHFFSEESLFDVIVTGEDVGSGKPNPEGYMLAIRQLGAKPEDCVIFEDSDVGIEAANASGAHVVRVSL